MSKIKLVVEIDEEDYGDFCDWFESVPSSVDGLPCVKGKFNTALYDAKPVDTSGDLISRGVAINLLNEAQVEYDEYYKGLGKAKTIIDSTPTVETYTKDDMTREYLKGYNACKDMNERPQGEWIKEPNGKTTDLYRCSVCKRSIMLCKGADLTNYPFCHCGADMRKGGAES